MLEKLLSGFLKIADPQVLVWGCPWDSVTLGFSMGYIGARAVLKMCLMFARGISTLIIALLFTPGASPSYP